MYPRKKHNKSGSISIQVIQKVNGKNKVVKSFGSSKDPFEIQRLYQEAESYIEQLKGQQKLPLFSKEEAEWFYKAFASIKMIELAGPELILGKIFDDIGFNQVDDELFKPLVITRITHPSSKLKTIRYLESYYNLHYEVDQIYRHLDRVHTKHKQLVQDISYEHTYEVLKGYMSIVFYDVTTIYFESEKEDELRIAGFSKDGKHKHPQILLGLLVSVGGYPLAYEIFKGNTYEGHTMLPVINRFKEKYNLENLVIVADAGLLTNDNILELIEKGYEFVLGARIKNESNTIKSQILSLKLKDGQTAMIDKGDQIKLLIQYSQKRSKKDSHNRQRGLKRLEKSLNKGKLTKSNINNRGYNKYLKMTGKLKISIDYEKFENDAKWDGLKGYITNTKYEPKVLLDNYSELWKIEKAFRISKTDLRIRPIYHRLQHRIEAHICISFTAYKVYKELERILKERQSALSINRAIEIITTIKAVTLQHPASKKLQKRVLIENPEQQYLLDLFNLNPGCPK